MRPWDNFFWWVELQGLPPRAMVDPANWPPSAGTQPVQVKGTINNKNGLNVRTRGDRQHPFWAKLEGATGRLQGA